MTALTRVRRTPISFIAALALAIGLALPVWAHAELLSTEPPAGATVPAGLRTLTLTFTEPLQAGSQAVVFRGQFEPVSGVTSGVEGNILHVLFTSALGEGTYTVQWTAIGSDGHPAEGSYQFAVSPAFGAGRGPQIVFASSLVIGLLALGAVVLLARRKRPTPA